MSWRALMGVPEKPADENLTCGKTSTIHTETREPGESVPDRGDFVCIVDIPQHIGFSSEAVRPVVPLEQLIALVEAELKGSRFIGIKPRGWLPHETR